MAGDGSGGYSIGPRNSAVGPFVSLVHLHVIEVRHKSWASAEALDLLKRYAIDQVLADPAPVWHAEDLVAQAKYVRLHGKPKIYYSSYADEEIISFSKTVGAQQLVRFCWASPDWALSTKGIRTLQQASDINPIGAYVLRDVRARPRDDEGWRSP